MILGLFNIFTNKFKINFHILILMFVLYFMFMLGWVEIPGILCHQYLFVCIFGMDWLNSGEFF